MDRIEIRGLRAFGRHGVFDEEQRGGQTFTVDLVVERDLRAPAASDALDDTVDYGRLASRVAAAVGETRFRLIEALAGHVADLVLADDRVAAVEVRVAKPEVVLPVDVDEVAVVIRRSREGGT